MTDRVAAAREYARIIEEKYFTGQRVNYVPAHVSMARMHIKVLLDEIDKLQKQLAAAMGVITDATEWIEDDRFDADYISEDWYHDGRAILEKALGEGDSHD